jgi:ribosomal protein S9
LNIDEEAEARMMDDERDNGGIRARAYVVGTYIIRGLMGQRPDVTSDVSPPRTNIIGNERKKERKKSRDRIIN